MNCKEERIVKEGGIKKFICLDDSIGIRKGKEKELKEKVKNIERKMKGVQGKLEIVKDGGILFLNMKARKTKENVKVKI